jgi:ABC-type multidrug transport system fused ATPase/permease subunit
MDIREYLGDIILIIILAIATWWFFSLLGATPELILAILLIVLSFAGLLLTIHHKVRRIEKHLTSRERMIKVNLEEISAKMAERYDSSVERVEAIVEEVSKRVYR